MLFLQIRQAECALADGRLEEACELVSQKTVREHRKGQQLVERLVDQLVARAQTHLEADRCRDACRDCHLATKLGGNQPKIAAVREAARARWTALDDLRNRQETVQRVAGQHIKNGDFSVGGRMLQELGVNSPQQEALAYDLALKRQKFDEALSSAETALSNKQWEVAIKPIRLLSRLRPNCPELPELTNRLVTGLLPAAREKFSQGQMLQSRAQLNRIGELGNGHIEVEELDQALQQSSRVAQFVKDKSYSAAAGLLSCLKAAYPEVSWIREAHDQVMAFQTAELKLAASPLGEFGLTNGFAETAGQTTRHHATTTPTTTGEFAEMPDRFYLHIDGAGSSLVIRRNVVTIGAAHSSHGIDVGLLAAANLPEIHLERTEDDYFLRTTTPIKVNGQTTTDRLLAHGDILQLSRRCQLKFYLPNAATASAVLELSSAKLPRADVRRVILMDDALVVAADPHAHLSVRGLEAPIVLYRRGGQWQYRMGLSTAANNSSTGYPLDMQLGRSMNIGPLTATVTAVETKA